MVRAAGGRVGRTQEAVVASLRNRMRPDSLTGACRFTEHDRATLPAPIIQG
jgi:hypothetical protein